MNDFLECRRRARELSMLRRGQALAYEAALPAARVFAMGAYLREAAVDDAVLSAQILLDLYPYDQAALVLRDLSAERLLSKEVAAAHVPRIWRHLEYPSSVLDRGDWLALFSLAGYTNNFRSAARPDEPILLYRGATYEFRYGLSWSEDKRVAAAFGGDHIWQGRFEPSRLLARITNAPSGMELEFVANPIGLDLIDVQGE